MIPLRPLSLGEILDGAVQMIRRNPRVMLGFSAVLIGLSGVITFLVRLATVPSRVDGADPFSGGPFAASFSSQGPTSFLVQEVLSWVVTLVLTGILVIAVSEAVLGRTPTVSTVWTRARRRVPALFGISITTALALTGVTLACALPGGIVLLAGSRSGGSLAVGVGLLVIGGLGALVLVIWMATRLLFAAPALLLEDLGVFAALGRSWRLVSGSWWRVFGIRLVAGILGSVVAGVLGVPFSIAGAVVGGDSRSGALLVVSTLLATLGQVVSTTLVAPFSAAILALLYIDLRMRREGLDVTLIRAAAAEGTTPGGGAPAGPSGLPTGTDPATPRW